MVDIMKHFSLPNEVLMYQKYGQGHINETYLVVDADGREYILQKINSHIFTDVKGLMHNIELVCSYMKEVEPDERKRMTIIPTTDNQTYYQDEHNQYWRMYEFISNSICLQQPKSTQDFRESAIAFGNFQRRLAHFNSAQLKETIPDFHNTPKRFEQLHTAIEEDKAHRVSDVKKEIDFALSYEDFSHQLMDKLAQGALPLKVTHNDTKLNNVMLDYHTRKALAVIDLDTVMPGLSVNDFGDSIRFGASTALEDEVDLSKVEISLERFRAYTNGFLWACHGSLSPEEINCLPVGAKMMTLECGIRFLTDYLQGDTYFHIQRPQHNLDRCRTQFKLVKDMDNKWDRLYDILQEEI